MDAVRVFIMVTCGAISGLTGDSSGELHCRHLLGAARTMIAYPAQIAYLCGKVDMRTYMGWIYEYSYLEIHYHHHHGWPGHGLLEEWAVIGGLAHEPRAGDGCEHATVSRRWLLALSLLRTCMAAEAMLVEK